MSPPCPEKPELNLENIGDYLEKIAVDQNFLCRGLKKSVINLQITESIGNDLLRQIPPENQEQIFDLMYNDYSTFKIQIPEIIKIIDNFNINHYNNNFIDVQKIFYITYFKKIEYVISILLKTNEFIDNNYNIVIIYEFIIKSFYDNPKISNYYIDILEFLIKKNSFPDENCVSFSPLAIKFYNGNVNKLKIIIKTIYSGDFVLQTIYKNWNESILTLNNELDSFDESTQKGGATDNPTPVTNATPATTATPTTPAKQTITDTTATTDTSSLKFTNIKELNNYYLEKIKLTIYQQSQEIIKREYKFNDINFKQLLLGIETNQGQVLPGILDGQSIFPLLIWYSFNLYMVSHFNFDLVKYITDVNLFLTSNNLEPNLTLTDFQNKLYFPQDILVEKSLTAPDSLVLQKGGNNAYENSFLKKYLKYKNKYLHLKNK